ncbi:MAG: hypothetical protein ACTS44_01245, partial [Candidatus Hodgkinia cicadicola]
MHFRFTSERTSGFRSRNRWLLLPKSLCDFIHINLSDWWYSPQPAVGPNFGRLKVHSSCRRGSLRRVTIQL